MIDLEAARATATLKVEHDGHWTDLQLLVFELCGEIEELRKNGRNPRTHSEE